MAFLNRDLMLFEFDFLEESNSELERGSNLFRGGVLSLDRWRPESGCVKSKNLVNEAWVRVVGLPLHLWTRETLKHIGDGCDSFLKVDKETALRTQVSRARILVRLKGMARPNTVNILVGSRSYELQIWWELPPWVARVYPSKREAVAGMQNPREEDEYSRCMANGACLGSAHTKSNFLARSDGDLTGKKVCDPLSHANAASRAAVLSLSLSLDLPDGESRANGLGTSVEDPILSRAKSTALSHKRGVSIKHTCPIPINPRRCRVSSLGRLEIVRPKMVPKKHFRAPSSLPKTILVRVKDPDFSIACSCADERYCLPSMLNLSPSCSILDRIPPSEEFFG